MSYQRAYVSYLTKLPYIKYILYGLILLAGITSYFGLRYYINRNAQTAQKVYAEAAEQYTKGIEGHRAAWEDLEFIARVGHQRHRSSVFGPYFIALQAESLMHQDKLEEAIKLMDTMIAQLAPTSPLYYMYKTKTALMKLDSQNSDIQEKGLQELIKISEDTVNKNADQALYFLGLYYWTTDSREKAHAYWNTLLTRYGSYTELKQSPWVERAQSILQNEA